MRGCSISNLLINLTFSTELFLKIYNFRDVSDMFYDADLNPQKEGNCGDGHEEEEEEEEGSDDEFHDCLETFDIEVEPTFNMPYSVSAESDDACVLMDKMIRSGKLSRNSFFYKNFHEVAKHLEDPRKQWDPEVCEALMSIKHLGGKSTMNHVIGPLSRGQGRMGSKDNPDGLFEPVLNYGGPSSWILQKFVPGIMPISGISRNIQLSCLALLKLSDTKTDLPRCELFSVALQMDGTMVRAGLSWDPKLGLVLSCKDPLEYQDLLDKDFQLSGSFLKQNLVTEVDVCLLVSLCTTVSLSLGYILQSNSGKTGREIVEKYTEIIKTVSKCENCVRGKPAHLNTISPQTPCSSLCQVCWDQGRVCEICHEKGRRTIYPQLEPCFQCLDKAIVCRKVVVHVLALDCFTGNRFMMEKFQKDLLDGTKDPEVALTEPIGEIIHVLKTIKSSFSNWFILGLGGYIFNLSFLRTLRDNNENKEITSALRKVLHKGSVVNRDRQDTDCLIEFRNSVPILREVAKEDPFIVQTVCPEKFKLEPSNKQGSLGAVRFIGAVKIGHIAVVCDDSQDKTKSVLSLLELHSPVRIKEKLDLPLVFGFVSTEAMVVVLTEKGMLFIEMVKGGVVPKIPTRKADLIALCRELRISCEGNVKLLKSRLTSKIKPSLKLHHRPVEPSTELKQCFSKTTILCKPWKEQGLMKSLTLVDNSSKKLILADLTYRAGEVSAQVRAANNQTGEIIKHGSWCEEFLILVSSSSLTILDGDLLTLSVLNLESPLADVCVINSDVFFLKRRQVCYEKLSNLVRGTFSPNVVVGNDLQLDKDGSGKSSSLLEPSSISSYQNSILIGTKSGKLKVVSKVSSIADFIENTFHVGVEGFGLHMKAEKRNESSNLETCEDAHKKLSDYFDELTLNIKRSFH